MNIGSDIGVPMGRVIVVIVRVYQLCVSPALPPACRFYPTCSQYMIDAVQKRGLIKGVSLGVWRILRCHPLSKGGYDPVK